jgi:hypothetical protein
VSYREAFLFGWSIAWRQLLWGLAIGIPLGLLVAAVVDRIAAGADARSFAFSTIFYPILAALMVLVIFPKAIRAATSKAFRTFRVQVFKRGNITALTYTDSVQISLLAMMVSMVLGGLYLLIEFPGVQLGLVTEVPLVVFVMYPAIAEATVYVPYRGFRLVVDRW